MTTDSPIWTANSVAGAGYPAVRRLASTLVTAAALAAAPSRGGHYDLDQESGTAPVEKRGFGSAHRSGVVCGREHRPAARKCPVDGDFLVSHTAYHADHCYHAG